MLSPALLLLLYIILCIHDPLDSFVLYNVLLTPAASSVIEIDLLSVCYYTLVGLYDT